MAEQDEERRLDSRRNLNLQVHYPDKLGYRIDVTESVSSGGLFIRSSQHHRVGEELRLAISLPGFPDSVFVSGVVSRIREATADSPRGVALQFAQEEYVQRLTEIMSPAESRDFNLATGPYAALASLPRIRLATTPTALHRAERLSKALGGPEIWFKRDDLTGFALGGNEVRKMEFLLADALEQGADTLVTTAPNASSSKVRVMAAAAARLGLRSVALLPAGASRRLDALGYSELLGTELRDLPQPVASTDENIALCMDDLREQGRKPYGLGDQQGWLAACGYMLASIETLVQLRRQNIEPEVMVCPVGGAETMSGLVLAQRWLDCSYDVLGFSVRHSERWCSERVANLAFDASAHLNIADTIPVDDIWVNDDFASGGSNGTSEATKAAALEAVRTVARLEGIFLAPDDSGIAMAGLLDRIERGELSKGQTVVFLHTGGPA